MEATQKRRHTRLGARLSPARPFPAAHGRVDYRADHTGRAIAVSLGGAPAGTAVAALFVDGRRFVTVPVSPTAASVSYAVDTRSGAPVPRLAAGVTVAWADAATGAVIVSGRLR